MSAAVTVTFSPSGATAVVPAGTTLLEAAAAAGLHLRARCGGNGTCGNCKVQPLEGDMRSEPAAVDVPQGFVLACRTAALADCRVEVPDESIAGYAQMADLSPSEEARRGKAVKNALVPAWQEEKPDPPVCLKRPTLPPPDSGDNRSDAERLLSALADECGVPGKPRIPLGTMKGLSAVLRESEWRPFCRIETAGGRPVLAAVSAQELPAPLGLAVDLGTTTIQCELSELASGAVLASASQYSDQAAFGEDVISRIVYAGSPEGLQRLNAAVVGQVDRMLDGLLEETGRDGRNVALVSVAGNTTMSHIFAGLDPANIRLAPYVPVTASYPVLSARAVGISAAPDARLALYPGVSSYVGGDIVSGLMATGVDVDEALTLFIDVGTNGEVVLGNSQWMVSAACSAGPAFEGGGMHSGSRAVPGAIASLRIPDSLEATVETIGNLKPSGICGSGYIEALAEMLWAGIIGPDGGLARSGHERIIEEDGGWRYIVTPAGESADGREVAVTNVDIDNLMRAKAAMYAGIRILLSSVEMTVGDVQRLILAGGFGRFIDIERATVIGLLPSFPSEKVLYAGNASLSGTRYALRQKDAAARAERLASSITNIELSDRPEFMEEYVAALFLPHTDASLFSADGWAVR